MIGIIMKKCWMIVSLVIFYISPPPVRDERGSE